jgi:hypothetical protein
MVGRLFIHAFLPWRTPKIHIYQQAKVNVLFFCTPSGNENQHSTVYSILRIVGKLNYQSKYMKLIILEGTDAIRRTKEHNLIDLK